MEIYILRHAETEYNNKGIIQGSEVDSNINTKHFNKVSTMIKDIKLNLIKGDAIYFKASRSLEFEKIINTI